MDPKDRSDMGGSSDAKNDATPDNFDGNTLKIDHNESAPVVDTPAGTDTLAEAPNSPEEPKHIIEPEKPAEPVEPVGSVEPAQLATPVQPTVPTEPAGPTEPTGPAETPQPAAPTTPPGVPVNPLARKAPDFIGTPKSSTLNFQNSARNTLQNDIPLVVAQPPQKKSKMPILVVAIISLVVIIGVAVFAIVQKQNGGNLFSQNAELVPKFNKYANYVLTGEEKEDTLNIEYNQNQTYEFTFIKGQVQSDSRAEYLNKVKELFDHFYTSTQTMQLNTNEAEKLNSYHDNFILTYTDALYPNDSQSVTQMLYKLMIQDVSSQSNNTSIDTQITASLTDYFKSYTDSGITTIQEYGSEALDYWKNFATPIYTKLFDRSKVQQCIIKNGQDIQNQELLTCLGQAILTTSISKESSDKMNHLNSIITDANKKTISQIWDINALLQGDRS